MCGNGQDSNFDYGQASYSSTPPKRPEDKLAELMRADLGTTCSAREVRMFIKANWRAVTTYAHAIHDGDEKAA